MTPKEIWLSVLLALLLIICVQAGGMGNSREDDMEFDEQLKFLNKKPIKSIQGENDNIIDCVEIHKQPAFDHPLLKNHKVQMRPTSLPQETLKTQTLETGNLRFRRIGCPNGTVPIQRASRKQLAWMKHEFSASMNSSLANQFYEKPTPSGYLFSRMVTNKRRILFGAQARVNIRAPNVSTGQLSTSTIWVQNKLSPELNSIQIGWMVNPELFGDNIPHLYGYWTADSFKKTGCYNMLCSGFVQVDADIYLGLPLYVPPHSEGVLQPVLDLLLSKDPKTESWWLVVTIKAGVSVSVGYWPSSIFSSMAHLATEIGIGGKIYNKGDKPAPQMGSGYYVTGDRSKTSYISRINILDESNKLVELKDTDLVIDADNPNCYPVKYFNKYNSVLFGGPIAPYC